MTITKWPSYHRKWHWLWAFDLLVIAFSCTYCGNQKSEPIMPVHDFKNGDLIFQISTSGQSKAIQLATHSKYSHCGILYQNSAGKWG
jgi:hypothetical protein